MGVSYWLTIYFKEQVDINSIIEFIANNGFVYAKDLGYSKGDELAEKLPSNEGIKSLVKYGGHICMYDIRGNGFGLGFDVEKNYLSISTEHFMLKEPAIQKFMKIFVEFINKNYPVKKIDEYLEHDKVNYFT